MRDQIAYHLLNRRAFDVEILREICFIAGWTKTRFLAWKEFSIDDNAVSQIVDAEGYRFAEAKAQRWPVTFRQLVSVPPQLAPAKLVQYMKGR